MNQLSKLVLRHFFRSKPGDQFCLTQIIQPVFPPDIFIKYDFAQQDQILKKASKHHADIQYVSLIDYFCRAEGCLVYYDPENIQASVTSWDYGHLTPVASYHFAKDVLIPLIMEQH